MIINKISMRNFQCYHGDFANNTFEFKKGLNIISGNNGGGKSKLYDAFLWVIYDYIFLSDKREFVKTSEYKESLISDKTKEECNLGDTVTTEVELVATSSQDTEFKLTRTFHATKIGSKNWACERSELTIAEKKGLKWELISRDKHEHILNRVLPNNLKPYMWFQGEQVDGLLDFKKEATLNNAINLLSDITVYDEFKEITKKLSEKADKGHTKASKDSSKNQQLSEEIDNDLAIISKKIRVAEEELKNTNENLHICEENRDSLLSKIDDAEKKATLKARKRLIETKITSLTKEITNIYNGFSKKLFTNYWVLRNISPVIQEFSDKYLSYFTEHQKIANSGKEAVVKLPLNIPQPVQLKQMIAEETCYVCNRDAKEGTEAYKAILKLLNRQDAPPTTEELFETDCSSYFQSMYNESLGMQSDIKRIDSNISNELKSLQDKKAKVSELNAELKDIHSNFESLLENDESESTISKFKSITNNIGKFQAKAFDLERNIKNLKNKKRDDEKKLANLVTGEIQKEIVISKKVFSELNEIAIDTRELVFSQIIRELEESSNSIFLDMTKGNNSITGKIVLKKLKTGAYVPEILDTNGNIIQNPNDANIIMVKLSIIMAIVTHRESWISNYCLISDAPTSKMAEEYSLGFYQALSKNFEQSIVMTYDFINETAESLIEKANVSTFYKIKANYPNGDRNDRTDLNIKIMELV